jgi:hypothetical protein
MQEKTFMNSTKLREPKFSVNQVARVVLALISVLFLQLLGLPVSPAFAASTCGYSNIVTGGKVIQLKELGDSPNYVGKADSNNDRYYFPKSTTSASEAGRLVVRNLTGNLENGGTIRFQTQDKDVWKESWLSYDLLGAFGNSNKLYYWTDYGNQSDWKVTRPSNSANTGSIQYGEPVIISNGYYNNQYLTPKDGYLSTTYDAHQWQFTDYDLRQLDFQRIEYDTKNGKISDPTPVVVGRGSAVNNGSTPNKFTVKLNIDQTKTSNFSRTEGVEWTIGRTFTAGIPEVASATASIQVSTNRSNTYGTEQSFTQSFGADYEVPVDPGKTEVVEAIATQAELSVPYVMYYRTASGNTVQSCGTWSGTTYYDINFTHHTAKGSSPSELGAPV